MKLGADCVVYSATKHIDGQGRVLGGMILASEKFIADHIHNFLRQTGPCLSPFNAWTLLKSLETLPVRVAAQTRTAAKIADFLSGHPAVVRTLYPGRADHPQAALARRQMEAGGTMLVVRGRRRQGGGVPGRQRAHHHRHLEQSRRRQEPHHPSGDDDPPAAQARAARGARHRPGPPAGCRSASRTPTT